MRAENVAPLARCWPLFDKRRGQGLHDDLAEAMARLGGAAVEPEPRQALTSKRRDLARAGARGLCFLPADVRRQMVSAHPRVVAMAGDHLERLVGSRFYADFDAWVARGGVRPPPGAA